MRDRIECEVGTLLASPYTVVSTSTVPGKDSFATGRIAYRLHTAILSVAFGPMPMDANANLSEVDCRVLSAFVSGAARIVRNHQGSIRGIAGEGMVAFFNPAHETPVDLAVWTALQLAYMAREVLPHHYPIGTGGRTLSLGMGVTFGEVLLTRAPIPGDNHAPLVWMSQPTRLAATLSRRALPDGHTIVSEEAYMRLRDVRTLCTGDQAWWEVTEAVDAQGATVRAYRTTRSLPF